jgi:hypothetical protein
VSSHWLCAGDYPDYQRLGAEREGKMQGFDGVPCAGVFDLFEALVFGDCHA